MKMQLLHMLCLSTGEDFFVLLMMANVKSQI